MKLKVPNYSFKVGERIRTSCDIVCNGVFVEPSYGIILTKFNYVYEVELWHEDDEHICSGIYVLGGSEIMPFRISCGIYR